MLTHPLTDGAELRALEPWHAEEFVAHVARARAHLLPWLAWQEIADDPDAALGYLRDYADRRARDEGALYGIWVDGVLSGGTLFRVFDTRAKVCEAGVWLAPEAVGRGLVTRAVRHMVDWAVGARGMERVEWRTVAGNERSLAVARRLGMTRDGVLRSAAVLNGVRHDVEVWSLLAPEWRALAPEWRRGQG
jgi:ribosomal-protein-serine acetyltransferase